MSKLPRDLPCFQTPMNVTHREVAPGHMALPRSGENGSLLRVFVRLQLPTGTKLEPQRTRSTHERTAGRKQLPNRTGYVRRVT